MKKKYRFKTHELSEKYTKIFEANKNEAIKLIKENVSFTKISKKIGVSRSWFRNYRLRNNLKVSDRVNRLKKEQIEFCDNLIKIKNMIKEGQTLKYIHESLKLGSTYESFVYRINKCLVIDKWSYDSVKVLVNEKAPNWFLDRFKK